MSTKSEIPAAISETTPEATPQSAAPVNDHNDYTPPVRQMTRRGILTAALFSAAVEAAHAAADCSCLPAPDCSAVCPNGGKPRGDGTQACDCNPPDCIPQARLAAVAYTGSYESLVDKPDLKTSLNDIVAAGSAGPTADVTRTYNETTGSGMADPGTTKLTIPYFKVDSKGRITAYGNRTLTLQSNYYSNYSNYYAYTNYKAYTNYVAYQNYYNYYNYSNYYDYNCCGDSDG